MFSFNRKKDEKLFNKVVDMDLLKQNKYMQFVEHIVSNMYKENNYQLFEPEIMLKMPQTIQHIMLIFDFETNIMMQGFSTYLGNSMGYFFEEVMDAFQRFGLTKDYEILRKMKGILDYNGINHHTMRYGEEDEVEEYDVVLASDKYESNEGKVFEQIAVYEEQLSVYGDAEQLLNAVLQFLEGNREQVVKEIEAFLQT